MLNRFINQLMRFAVLIFILLIAIGTYTGMDTNTLIHLKADVGWIAGCYVYFNVMLEDTHLRKKNEQKRV
jgi:hypothetical protein